MDMACPKCHGQAIRTVWTDIYRREIKFTEECVMPGCDREGYAKGWHKVDHTAEGYDESVYVESLGPPCEPSDL